MKTTVYSNKFSNTSFVLISIFLIGEGLGIYSIKDMIINHESLIDRALLSDLGAKPIYFIVCAFIICILPLIAESLSVLLPITLIMRGYAVGGTIASMMYLQSDWKYLIQYTIIGFLQTSALIILCTSVLYYLYHKRSGSSKYLASSKMQCIKSAAFSLIVILLSSLII